MFPSVGDAIDPRIVPGHEGAASLDRQLSSSSAVEIAPASAAARSGQLGWLQAQSRLPQPHGGHIDHARESRLQA